METPQPILPGINVVLVTPNRHIRDVLIIAICQATNLKPALKSDSVSAQRVQYPPATTKQIINTASPEMHRILGQHSAVMAIEVADRVAAAQAFAKVFTDYGYEATVHTQAEPEFPEGFLVFVSVPALLGIAMMFWPRPQDVTSDLIGQLPRRQAWSVADLWLKDNNQAVVLPPT